MRGVFLDYGTVDANDLDASALHAALPGLVLRDRTPPEDVAATIAGCEAVLTNKVRLDRALIEGTPSLRIVALTATGTDNVDLAAAKERGVAVCNLRDYCTASVAQHVFALLLALTHKVREYDDLVQDGEWAQATRFSVFRYPIRELSGLTFGIVGWGVLGRATARIAESLGMRVIVAQRPGEPGEMRYAIGDEPARVPLDQLLPQVDVLSLHCPLTPATRGMIGAAQLARMKRTAVIINTARGALIDVAALAEALKAGTIGGAGIDVLAQEPPVDGSPLIDRSVPNLIVTPHVAWAAREARQRCLDELAANVRAFVAGERRNRVV